MSPDLRRSVLTLFLVSIGLALGTTGASTLVDRYFQGPVAGTAQPQSPVKTTGQGDHPGGKADPLEIRLKEAIERHSNLRRTVAEEPPGLKFPLEIEEAMLGESMGSGVGPVEVLP